ncbi:hypothetical protein TNCV_4786301, partial [Trichonephila clavipes]
LFEGDARNRWRDGPVCPAVDKELWRLGPRTVSEVFLACYAPIGRERSRETLLTCEERKDQGKKPGEESKREEEAREGEQETPEHGKTPRERKTMNAGGVESMSIWTTTPAWHLIWIILLPGNVMEF